MVSIVLQQARAAWPFSRGSGFNMAEGHRSQHTDFTVTVLPRSDHRRESDSERGPTPGEETPRDGQDARGEQRSGEEETDCEITLSVEDEMRIHQKRERNRLAAARCRDRRRQRAATLVQESDDLEDENEGLMKEIAQLQKEKLKFEEILCKHLPNCGVQPGKSNQQQQQIPHRLHGKHPRLEHHPQHQHLQPRQYQRQHQHPLLLNQQHRQQVLKQQHPQRPIQEHHPQQQKPDLRQVHRPQRQQGQQQYQLQHQQYDQQTTTTNQLI